MSPRSWSAELYDPRPIRKLSHPLGMSSSLIVFDLSSAHESFSCATASASCAARARASADDAPAFNQLPAADDLSGSNEGNGIGPAETDNAKDLASIPKNGRSGSTCGSKLIQDVLSNLNGVSGQLFQGHTGRPKRQFSRTSCLSHADPIAQRRRRCSQGANNERNGDCASPSTTMQEQHGWATAVAATNRYPLLRFHR